MLKRTIYIKYCHERHAIKLSTGELSQIVTDTHQYMQQGGAVE